MLAGWWEEGAACHSEAGSLVGMASLESSVCLTHCSVTWPLVPGASWGNLQRGHLGDSGKHIRDTLVPLRCCWVWSIPRCRPVRGLWAVHSAFLHVWKKAGFMMKSGTREFPLFPLRQKGTSGLGSRQAQLDYKRS